MLPLLKECKITHLNLNNCNRPSTIANSQNHLITHKRPTTVVNGRPYTYIYIFKSEFDVAIMHVGVNNLLNLQGYIDQISNILEI